MQADYANKNFYPNKYLGDVVTAMNLVSLLQQHTGLVRILTPTCTMYNTLNTCSWAYNLTGTLRISINEEEDRCMDEESFAQIVTELLDSFCRLEWLWLGGPGTLGVENF